MEFFIALLVGGILTAIKYAVKQEAAKDAAAESDEPQSWDEVAPTMQTVRDEAPPPAPKAPAESKRAQAAQRVRAVQAELWSAAKRQQDDAEQVHAVHMDSCESKLQSLRTLYEAGILDREEYAQRVARVKAAHRSGAQ